MIDVSKLPKKMMENIARNMGYEDGDDFEEYKAQMSRLDEIQLLRLYCAWHLGSQDWADFFLEAQGSLRNAEVTK